MKKKVILISSTIVFFTLLLSFIKIKNKVTLFSDYILNEYENSNRYNYSFSNNNLTSDLLLEYLDYNAIDIQQNIKINKLIKKSKNIFISVGMNDLLQYVSNINNKLVYNPTIIYQKMALLEYNISEIMNSILAIDNVNIYYVSLYYFNDEAFDEIIKEYNEEIKVLLEGIEVNYIEINNIITIENYTFTNKNKEILYEYIDSII